MQAYIIPKAQQATCHDASLMTFIHTKQCLQYCLACGCQLAMSVAKGLRPSWLCVMHADRQLGPCARDAKRRNHHVHHILCRCMLVDEFSFHTNPTCICACRAASCNLAAWCRAVWCLTSVSACSRLLCSLPINISPSATTSSACNQAVVACACSMQPIVSK